MAQVRDPAFWKRFSTAVHLNDVEATAGSAGGTKPPNTRTNTGSSSNGSSSSLSKRPALDHQDSWLARQERKKKKRTVICWAFWLGLAAFGTIVVIVVIWLVKSGALDRLKDAVDGPGR